MTQYGLQAFSQALPSLPSRFSNVVRTKYALLSELLHDSLCNIPTYYNQSKIDLLSLRLSSMGRSLFISATRITSVLDYSGAAIIIHYILFVLFS